MTWVVKRTRLKEYNIYCLRSTVEVVCGQPLVCVGLIFVTRIMGFLSPGGETEKDTLHWHPHFLDVFLRCTDTSFTGTHGDFPAQEHTKAGPSTPTQLDETKMNQKTLKHCMEQKRFREKDDDVQNLFCVIFIHPKQNYDRRKGKQN